MDTIYVALIGLAGTVFAGVLAYLQFRKGHTTALRQKQAERLQEIYESVWSMTEDMAFGLRETAHEHTEVALEQQIRDINEFLLKNQLFIPVRINGLVETYLSASKQLAARLALPEYQRYWHDWHASTAFVEREIPPAEAELGDFIKKWRINREALLEALRKPFNA